MGDDQMSLSSRTKNALKIGLADLGAANELITAVNSAESGAGTTPSSPVVPVAVTFTASAPATYASPTGALTVANGGTPTVAELVAYCDELRANIVAIQAVLHAQGLTS